MMEALLSREVKGTFDVQLSGGSPWGFTLQGGSEFNSKLCVAKITPGGKADQTNVLSIGDQVVAINGMICTLRAEAIEQIRCSRQNVRLTIKRHGGPSIRQNGIPKSMNSKQDHTKPNLYQTALEVATGPDDFFTTFSVDPAKYARLTEHTKTNKPKNAGRDYSLSESNEDLLAMYWGPNTNIKGSNSNLASEKATSPNIANGRMSPEEETPVVPDKHRQIINTLHARARSWSDHRGQSLPEGPHGRHYTSPSRIQKVKVTSANISSSSSSLGGSDDDRHSPGRPSSNQRSPVARQPHVAEGSLREDSHHPVQEQHMNRQPNIMDRTTTEEQPARPSDVVERRNVASQAPKEWPTAGESGSLERKAMEASHTPRDADWFGRWLQDDEAQNTDKNISITEARSRFETPDTVLDAKPLERSSNFSRSKSFSGRPSYGVMVATTMKGEGKSAHPEISTFQAPLPPARYSSSGSLREKPSRKSLPVSDLWKSSTISLPAEVDSSLSRVATIHEGEDRSVKVQTPISPKSTVSASTVSLDSIFMTDSNAARRMGPAPPPRRSESKLLSSFRTGKRRSGPQVVASSSRATNYREPRQQLQEPPRHVASKSWPSDHLGDNSRTYGGESDRQSWHAQPSQGRDPRERQTEPWQRQSNPRERQSNPRERQSNPREMQSNTRERQSNPREMQSNPRESRQSGQGDRQPDPKDRHPNSRVVYPEPRESQMSPRKSTSVSVRSIKTSPSSSSYDPTDGMSRSRSFRVSSSSSSLDGGRYRGSASSNSYDGDSRAGYRGSNSSYDIEPRPVYKSASVEFRPGVHHNYTAIRPQSAKSRMQSSPGQTKPEQPPAPAETGPSRIEDTDILQKLMKDNEANSRPSVQSRIKTFEFGSPQPTIQEGPDVQQVNTGLQQQQATWDKSRATTLQKNSEPKSRYRDTKTPPPVMPRKPREETIVPSEKESDTEGTPQESEASPVRVASMARGLERIESPKNVQGEDFPRQRVIVTTSPVAKQTLDVKPVSESVERSQSTSEQEKEVIIEELFKKMSAETIESEPKPGQTGVAHEEILPPPPSVGDDEVFAFDDSLPPPPPSFVELETSHDNLPLPTPPREVLMQGSKAMGEGREETLRRQIVQVVAVEQEVQKSETTPKQDLNNKVNKMESLSKEDKFLSRENLDPKTTKSARESSTKGPTYYPLRRVFVPEEENKRNLYKMSRSMEDLSIDRGFGKEEYLSRVINESRKRFGDEYKRHSYHNDVVTRRREEFNAKPILTQKQVNQQKPVQQQLNVSARGEEKLREESNPPKKEGLQRDKAVGVEEDRRTSFVDNKSQVSPPRDVDRVSPPSEERSSFHEEKQVQEQDISARDEKRASFLDEKGVSPDEKRTSFVEVISPDGKRNYFQDENRSTQDEKRTSFNEERRVPTDEIHSSFHEENRTRSFNESRSSCRDESITSLSSNEIQRERSFSPISPDRSLPVSNSSSDRTRERRTPERRTPEQYCHRRGELPAPLVITSTPTKEEEARMEDNRGFSGSPFSEGSNLSTPSSSRPNSMVSPKLEALDKEKCELVDSMKRKIEDLRSQMNEISDEIGENERLGSKVTLLVEGKTTASEFSKYQRFTGELNKIVLLLLSLTQRMHRYEKTLGELDMSEEADRQQRDVLQDKIEYVKNQYEEACKIKEVNDKRGEVVSKFLESYLEEEEFADFQYYIDMKTQLALMHAEIRDKVKMGEERLALLSTTEIDWSVTSMSSY